MANIGPGCPSEMVLVSWRCGDTGAHSATSELLSSSALASIRGCDLGLLTLVGRGSGDERYSSWYM